MYFLGVYITVDQITDYLVDVLGYSLSDLNKYNWLQLSDLVLDQNELIQYSK